jgi:hypothetical protein
MVLTCGKLRRSISVDSSPELLSTTTISKPPEFGSSKTERKAAASRRGVFQLTNTIVNLGLLTLGDEN